MSLFSTFIVTVFYANQCLGSLINHGFVWYFAHLGFVEIAPRFSVSGNILFFCYDYLILIFSVLFFFSFLLASSGNVIINILFFWFWLLDYLILITWLLDFDHFLFVFFFLFHFSRLHLRFSFCDDIDFNFLHNKWGLGLKT